MTGGSGGLASVLVLGVAIAGLVIACSHDSSPQKTGGTSGSGGGGQSSRPANGGSGLAGEGAAQAGSGTSGNPQGGFSGTAPGSMGGGGTAHGGNENGATAAAGTSDGGSAGESNSGGSADESNGGGAAGAGQECQTATVAQPPAATCAVAPDVTQEYKVGLATDVISFGVRLRATGFFGAVNVNEIEVQYYYSQEETSGFQPSVDSFILQPSGLDLTASSEVSVVALDPKQSSTSGPGCQTHFVRIRNSSPIELPSGALTYAEVHVTLTPNNLAPPNQNQADDHSYVPEATSWTETNLLGVFHCGQLTSGCTPGDGGTCN